MPRRSVKISATATDDAVSWFLLQRRWGLLCFARNPSFFGLHESGEIYFSSGQRSY